MTSGAAPALYESITPPLTPDGRYIVVRGRLWRAANPGLSPDRREALVRDLMEGRRAVSRANQAGDAVARRLAREAVEAAKLALGERGAPWWDDETPDLNRHMARNTLYADWYRELTAEAEPVSGVLIGTAGWSIPRAAVDAFPGTGGHLNRYVRFLAAAEINSSFHRPHRRSTYERWAAATPRAFRFSAKIPRTISHDRKLVDTADLLDAFALQVGGLKEKLGVILLQLPPSFAFDRDVVSKFLVLFRRRFDRHVAIACEPRHPSWSANTAEQCLVDHRVARVMADPVFIPGGERPGGWTGLRYRRLHGSPRVYHSAYDAPFLATLAATLAAEEASSGTSWCIFDNTASGAAATDALSLCRGIGAALSDKENSIA